MRRASTTALLEYVETTKREVKRNMRAILFVTSSLLEGEETSTDGTTESDSASDEIDL